MYYFYVKKRILMIGRGFRIPVIDILEKGKRPWSGHERLIIWNTVTRARKSLEKRFKLAFKLLSLEDYI
jgi:hypothetical protein